MIQSEKTTMGGMDEVFQTTHWSEIHGTQMSDDVRRREIVEKLLSRYWKPVYCYLRRKGYDNEQAKDLTQGFFHEIVLGKSLFQQSEEAKGRFRTFLLTTLDRYVVNLHEWETAGKRVPPGRTMDLETAELFGLAPAAAAARPDQIFQYAWAANLLDQVLAKVKDECYSARRASHWEVFRAKVLAPIFDEVDTPALVEICARYGIDSESKASNMILTVKRRFRAVLRDQIRQFVGSDSEVEQEFAELFEILSEGCAR
jgi:RNA polymerase sigma-70 factor (ECF subfamily)